MRRLLILTVILIVYGSLYPWRFHALMPGQNPATALLHSWPPHLFRATLEDIGLNLILYVPVGFCAFLSFSRRYGTGAALSGAWILGTAVSALVEMSQQFVLWRNTSMSDLMSNSLGTLCGAVLGWFVLHRGMSDWAEHWLQRADALLLMLGWIAWQIFPVTPFVTRSGDLVVSFRLADGPAPAALLEFCLRLVEVLALARVAEALTGAPLTQSRSLRLGFGSILLLVPLRAIIWGRGVSLVEVIAVGVAYALCVYGARIPALPLLLAALIAIAGIAPFHFSASAQQFSWVPFRSSLESDWFTGTPVLLGKAFRFGLLVWLLVEARWKSWPAIAAVVALAAILEVIQLWLPGHSPEITDPLLPLLGGYVLWVVRDTFDSLPSVSQVR